MLNYLRPETEDSHSLRAEEIIQMITSLEADVRNIVCRNGEQAEAWHNTLGALYSAKGALVRWLVAEPGG